jgi:hypothetical protein
VHDGAAGSLDLAGGNPPGFKSLQAKFPEGNFSAAQGFAAHPAAHGFAPFHTLWHQHNSHLFQFIRQKPADEDYSLT